MSCHAKRAALWAEHLAEQVLLAVPHEQWVFTVPKRLRLFFLYDRSLLGELARCAWSTVRDLYLAGLADPRGVPGMVASVQTFGDLANWQPHIHALVTPGVVDRDGEFTPHDRPSAAVAEELFRRRVLKMLVGRGKLDEEAAAGLLAWPRSGFSVHNSIRVEPEDRRGLDRLCRYLVHPPIALERLDVPGASRPCTYTGRRPHPVTGEQSVTADPLEMLARLCSSWPPHRSATLALASSTWRGACGSGLCMCFSDEISFCEAASACQAPSMLFFFFSSSLAPFLLMSASHSTSTPSVEGRSSVVVFLSEVLHPSVRALIATS